VEHFEVYLNSAIEASPSTQQLWLRDISGLKLIWHRRSLHWKQKGSTELSDL